MTILLSSTNITPGRKKKMRSKFPIYIFARTTLYYYYRKIAKKKIIINKYRNAKQNRYDIYRRK